MDAVARGGLRENTPRNAEGAIIMQQASLSAYGGRVPSIIGTLLSPLSLVGYNNKDLLYSAIRVHHVQATGRSLADIPSFGGNSGLTIDWGKINFGSKIETTQAAAAEFSRKALGIIVRTLGRGIFLEPSDSIFTALYQADRAG